MVIGVLSRLLYVRLLTSLSEVTGFVRFTISKGFGQAVGWNGKTGKG